MNIFSTDGALFRALNLIADILLLHILWILFSLPIITIGASTTALYDTAMKRVRKDENYTIRTYFTAFTSNFKQSTLLWILVCLIGFILYLDIQISMAAEGTIGTIMLIGCSTLLIPYLFTALYIFPVQAKFENRMIDNIKNAFLLSFSNFGYTLLLLVVIVTFAVLGISSVPVMGILIVCGAGLFGYLSAGIFVMVFRKYIPDEFEEDLEKNGVSSGK